MDHAGIADRRQPFPASPPAPMDQRRADHRLLLRRRPRDQARTGQRAVGDEAGSTAADRGRGGRHGGTRAALPRHRRRERAAGLGNRDRHRHPTGTRHPRHRQQSRATRAAGVPAGPGHRRRHRVAVDHRRVLLDGHRMGLARSRGRRARRGGHRPTLRLATPVDLHRAWLPAVVDAPRGRNQCHARRRGDGPAGAHDGTHRPGVRRCRGTG